MTIKQSAIDIYAALQAVESDLEVVGTLSGMSETVEFVSLTNNVASLHTALNELRKLLGMTWDEFLAFIGQETEVSAKGVVANVGGSGGKD